MVEEPKVAVIVGVGAGLGSALVRRFVRGGFDVAMIARSSDSLAPVQSTIEKVGGRSVALTLDSTSQERAKGAIERIGSELGAPSVLVYNAGVFRTGSVLEVDPTQLEQDWRVNCMGAFIWSREVLPAMLAASKGTILLTGATASLRGAAGFSSLAIGKFGLRALSQSLARECGPRGIHVAHVVIDGQIDTPRIRALHPEREPHTLLSPEAIAESYWQLHVQDPSAWTLELDLRPSVERF